MGVFLSLYGLLGVPGRTFCDYICGGSHLFLLLMTKKSKQSSKCFNIPAQLESIELKIFITSWLEAKEVKKKSNTYIIYGIDLLSRKICPDLDLLFSLISEIVNDDISNEDIYSAKFHVPKSIVKEILSRDFISESNETKGELLEIWTTIATHETIEFINYLLKRIKADPVAISKVRVIVERLLQQFGTGQLWNLAYRTSLKTSELILAQELKGEERSNLFLELFMQKGNQYIENGWRLDSFKRWGFQCRQSVYSKYFFEQVLGISEKGFTCKPSLSSFKDGKVLLKVD